MERGPQVLLHVEPHRVTLRRLHRLDDVITDLIARLPGNVLGNTQQLKNVGAAFHSSHLNGASCQCVRMKNVFVQQGPTIRET